tara:strand:+ start:907 stop:1068 length:162 start_codon:yes stop_codon:yes gene_type:complete
MSYLLFLNRVANLKKVKTLTKDPDMKEIWERKLQQLIEDDRHERIQEGARSVH